ncbi:MAG: NADH-quinone oxidoreductase subunit NuoF [Firmicutes bacterium]|nr:NADH-quinone oxidoreductase subunit NuoF [Bacillota bacterium]NSW92543.1 NADH-quinone oxidoreductase subunit NuoF [Bacillota bacterium]
MNQVEYQILVCGGGGCESSGCQEIVDKLNEELERTKLSRTVTVVKTGCMGLCALGPLMTIYPDGIFYKELTVKDIPEIVEKHLLQGKVVERLLYHMPDTGEPVRSIDEIPFFARQKKIALRNVGLIDPLSIEEYIAFDGYFALAKVLSEMEPQEVIEEMKKSGLRGRGGGGFPTGIKWEFAYKAKGDEKYVVCNADEGDPGAYMDRSIIEGDPHTVIEGMAIAGYAIGAKKGYVYIRAEYPMALERLQIAIEQARNMGLLGDNIMNSGFSFDLEIRVGAGAFVCGEETALIRSIQGLRGEPRIRPPFPANEGVWNKPTLINNVETWANVPPIILNGGDWLRTIGTPESPGTKVFALAGKAEYAGLVEVPMGTSLGEIIFDIGGGLIKGKKLKAAQTGGPSGGCIPVGGLNVPVDYESLKEMGTIMGSGGLIVIDEDTCMVDLARFFLEFVQEESCGKCTPCREGTRAMLQILDRIVKGEGRQGDIEKLESLGNIIKSTALCGLGQTAPNPVLNAIRYFREEFEEHINHKRCPASSCASLFSSPCINACPAGVDVPRFIEEIQRGRFDKSVEVIMENNPFPGICGRICGHPCEAKCQRAQVDEAMDIRVLKRFVADWEMEHPGIHVEVAPDTGKRVAVVGAGPAGLTAAYYLRKWGHRVTIFEEHKEPGGMLVYAIPEFRLPRNVIKHEIQRILDLGINLVTGVRVGKDISLNKLREEYDAVFVAVGSQEQILLDIPGENLTNVHFSFDFLQKANAGNPPYIGNKVAVIGGGNCAIDMARFAIRLGAKEVKMIYRRSAQDMQAMNKEIRDGMEEGVIIEPLTAPLEIIGDEEGKVKGLKLVRMKQGEFDRSGRKKPVPIKGSEYTEEFDSVIVAIGMIQDIESLNGETSLEIDRYLRVVVDPHTQQTSVEGVFAGGDCSRGPDTVVGAVGDGRRAALNIDRYLGGNMAEQLSNRKIERRNFQPVIEEKMERMPPDDLLPVERKYTFNEVEGCPSKERAVREASRCLRCDVRD